MPVCQTVHIPSQSTLIYPSSSSTFLPSILSLAMRSSAILRNITNAPMMLTISLPTTDPVDACLSSSLLTGKNGTFSYPICGAWCLLTLACSKFPCGTCYDCHRSASVRRSATPRPPLYELAPPTHFAQLPIPNDNYLSPSVSGNASLEHVTSYMLHPGLTTAFVYDLRRHPKTARLWRQSDTLLLDIHSHECHPLLEFPHSTTATYPPTSSLTVEVGPFRRVCIVPSCGDVVTCGDILSTLYVFLQQPLYGFDRLDIDYHRLMITHKRRVLAKGYDDVVRNLDALFEKTESLRLVPSRGDRHGTKWALETKRPWS